jgi:hypothetical protein
MISHLRKQSSHNLQQTIAELQHIKQVVQSLMHCIQLQPELCCG